MVLMVKNLPENTGNIDTGLIPASGRSPGGGNGSPLKYSGLEDPKDGGALGGYNPWGCKELNATKVT